MFDWDEAKRDPRSRASKGIGMHLDGARLFIARRTPASRRRVLGAVRYGLRSLWKYFNCGIGAIPRGTEARPRRYVPRPPDVRRQPRRRWNAALVARHFMEDSKDG
jgi:hypothetical protein